MTVGTIARYLIGDAQAIREAAASKATFWIGIVLVLITSIPRNYDQTYILEKPLLWVFGPLLFSIVSGTWLCLITYRVGWQRYLPLDDNWKVRENPQAWRIFMGLFWLTAPIAWLYAIPVERLMDSISAAKANVVLLGIVSLWRVLLMSRVMQVLSGAHFFKALMWVLIPVCIEVLALAFFGGTILTRIMAGMMGMRNSPEEEILISTMSVAFGAALFSLPVVLILASIRWLERELSPLPEMKPGRIPWANLGIVMFLWGVLAIYPQRQVARNWQWEQYTEKREYAEALSYAAQYSRSDFAPARPLPPKAYEWTIFLKLPPMIGAIKGDETVWLREHLIQRLNEMCSHWKNKRYGYDPSKPETELIKSVASRMGFGNLDLIIFKQLLEGLQRFPEGQTWLKNNQLILKAIRQHLESEKSALEKDSSRAKVNASLLDEINQGLKILDELGVPHVPAP